MKGTCGRSGPASHGQGFAGGLGRGCSAPCFNTPKLIIWHRACSGSHPSIGLWHISLYLRKEERFQSPFGSCWLGFDCGMRQQDLLSRVPVGCGSVLAFGSVLLGKAMPCSEERVTVKSCLLLPNIPVQKQGCGPNSASRNNLWAKDCRHLESGQWAGSMGITPEWIIWGGKSFCQCKSTLVYSSSVGSYDFFISLEMFDLVFDFFP